MKTVDRGSACPGCGEPGFCTNVDQEFRSCGTAGCPVVTWDETERKQGRSDG